MLKLSAAQRMGLNPLKRTHCLAREALQVIIRVAGQAAGGPLNLNGRPHRTPRNMKRLHLRSAICALAILIGGCTYAIRPNAPDPSIYASPLPPAHCKAQLLIPSEFATRQFVSTFEGREIRLEVGPTAAEAMTSLVRSRFSQPEVVSVSGDGSIDVLRLLQSSTGDKLIVLRPRFQRVDSSVRPFRLNFEIVVSLDIASSARTQTVSGTGVGTAGVYAEAEIQRAANTALSGAFEQLASSTALSCQ